MANLERIVSVSIALDTAGISKKGFSTIGILGVHAYSTNRSDTVTDVDDLTSMGFATTDPIYLAASAAFSQTPRPSQVKILRWDPAGAGVIVGTVAAGTYTLTVSAVVSGSLVTKAYTYTATSSDTASTILAGLKAAIEADSAAVVSGTIATSTLALTPVTAGTLIDYAISNNLSISWVTPTETLAAALTAIAGIDNDWYGLILSDRTQADILAVAAWAETHTKLFITAIAEPGALVAGVSTDTGSLLRQKDYFRTAWMYHALAATEYADAAWAARVFSIDPGGETWALKTLAGITADGLTETQYTSVTGKNGNTYEKVRNILVTQNGKVAAGEWIDIIRFRDWLQEEIETDVFTLMKNADKIPYDDVGFAMIEAQVNKALDAGVTAGGIAPVEYDDAGNKNPSYVVTVPLAADISAAVKASRIFSGIKFTARVAGAIHVTDITGSLTYESLTSTDSSTAS